MKLSPVRVIAASATTLALGVGVPMATMTAASAATVHGSAVSAAAKQGTLTSTVTGTFTNANGQGTFKGTFTPSKFSVVNGVAEATGVLKGTLTNANGTSVGTVSQTATIPLATGSAASAAAAPAACNVLNLVLGPLNLNLLGLVVTLNQVDLNITAVPGAGALLGNLLCDVANLLNSGGALSTITTDLNAILAALGL